MLISNELMSILLLTCGAIESLFKDLKKEIKPLEKARMNINKYYPIITKEFNDLKRYRVVFSINYSFKPWEKWTADNAPKWWMAYNAIKHDRMNNIKEANLKNCILAIGALYLILVLYEQKHLKGFFFTDNGELFYIGGNA